VWYVGLKLNEKENRMAKYVHIEDGTMWPNPKDDVYRDVAYKLFHDGTLTDDEKLYAGFVMESFSSIVNNPGFTLETVRKKVSGIRKAIKQDPKQAKEICR
jgi:hypothetical protein